MLPKTLALVDDDAAYSEFLAQFLRDRGVDVTVFGDSNDLLAHPDPYAYEFYVLDLRLPGIDGVDLIKLLRRRSEAGMLIVSGRVSPDLFGQVIDAGADMHLGKPVTFQQVAIALKAVQRRASTVSQTTAAWKLDRRARRLVAPDGARVDLSDADLAVLDCFVEADGQVVTREALRHRLGNDVDLDAADATNATIYRLRRRIERCTPCIVPLQSKSRVGYVFRAPLKLV